jgi:hypothetical protein
MLRFAGDQRRARVLSGRDRRPSVCEHELWLQQPHVQSPLEVAVRAFARASGTGPVEFAALP